ncbi:neuropeptide-like protein 30 [Gigantopelta aegis]|uniref:neuropeptide-like protein 30 n=1 Tax=Gigantopelta aegis TaxID=1735272 RepID=UPI001B88B7CA|nr:neuropeptide-like protein 30 [Gigantopelta aegis]
MTLLTETFKMMKVIILALACICLTSAFAKPMIGYGYGKMGGFGGWGGLGGWGGYGGFGGWGGYGGFGYGYPMYSGFGYGGYGYGYPMFGGYGYGKKMMYY